MYSRTDYHLERSRIALNNALTNEALQVALADFGYDADRLQVSMTLYEEAHIRVQQQVDAQREQVAATYTFQKAWKQARRIYHHALRAARLALQDYPKAQHNLQLRGKRYRSFPAWLKQAQQFYAGLLDDAQLAAAVVEDGITPKRLQMGWALLQVAQQERSMQRQQQGANRKARRERNVALQALHKWMTAFAGVARLALVDMPDQLMTLGLVTRQYAAARWKRKCLTRSCLCWLIVRCYRSCEEIRGDTRRSLLCAAVAAGDLGPGGPSNSSPLENCPYH